MALPVESRKYLKLLAEQGLLQFFVAVKVRENKQLFLKVSPLAFTHLLLSDTDTDTHAHVRVSVPVEECTCIK